MRSQPSPTPPVRPETAAEAFGLLLPWINGDVDSPADVRLRLRAFLLFFDGSPAANRIHQTYDGTADARRGIDYFREEHLTQRWWDERWEPGDYDEATTDAEDVLFQLRVTLRDLLEEGFGDDAESWAPDDELFELLHDIEDVNGDLPPEYRETITINSPRQRAQWWPREGWESLRVGVRSESVKVATSTRKAGGKRVYRTVAGAYVATVNGTLADVVPYLVVQLLIHGEDGLLGRCVAPLPRSNRTKRCGRFFIKRSGERGAWRKTCDRAERNCGKNRNDELIALREKLSKQTNKLSAAQIARRDDQAKKRQTRRANGEKV